MTATALIVSGDASFAETMETVLRQWGLVVVHQQDAAEQDGEGIAVALIDIRLQADERLDFLASLKGRHPRIEAILINRADNIPPSIAGMRAGAADELITPFDTDTLKNKIFAALSRQRQKNKRSLLKRFGDAMAAATFAQAGEFDTAVAMLETPPEERPDGKQKRKKSP